MSKIVLALGGNALGNTPQKQLELIKNTSRAIVDLIEPGNEVTVVHGNGPQVGMIHLAMSIAAGEDEKIPLMPYPECGAMSQGYIGYHLQQAIGYELRLRKMDRPVSTVVTQVIVDEKDPAFKNPTKPVGRFYTKEEADLIAASNGATFTEDAGRGYRQVVASPEPKRIVEIETVKRLVGAGEVVITVGGGGIPVVETSEGPRGVMAVIDKDKSAALLAKELDADILMILTAVEKVCLDYNTPAQRELDQMSVAEAKRYIEEGHFAKGSMLPKVEACIRFLEEKPGSKALISSLECAKAAIDGKTGTVIS